MKISLFCLFFGMLITSCNTNSSQSDINSDEISFYFGADLSYVNEMDDCGALYKNADRVAVFKTGTEACMAAIRVSRAVNKKSLVF